MVSPIGPTNARVMIVGEAPGREEVKEGRPFVGSSGKLLREVLSSAGIDMDSCFITNVAREQPPGNKIEKFFANKTEAKKEGLEEVMGRFPRSPIVEGMEKLDEEILRVNPNIIVALGNTALWALTGETGITSWRGSVMEGHRGYKVVPTIHPALVLRQYPWRNLLSHDLKMRVVPEMDHPKVPEPDYNFIVRPSFEQAMDTLNWILDQLESSTLRLASDIETRSGQITCEGLAWSSRDAISIPFLVSGDNPNYWHTEKEETDLVWKIRQIHEHPNAEIVGQNFNYDRQYFAKLWGFWSPMYMDTMTAHHTCWPTMKKSLEFLSSLYCSFHRYWKDESQEWDPKLGEEQLWTYNCKDVAVTREISFELDKLLDKMNVREQYNFQMRMQDHVLRSILRGVNYDQQRRDQLGIELVEAMQEYGNWFTDMLGTNKIKQSSSANWYDSNDQLAKLFFEELGIKPVRHPKTGQPTTSQQVGALKKIGKREPLVKPICDALAEYRSFGTYYRNFVKVKLDPHDGRFRFNLNVDGTETFRMSGGSDAFGVGANVQNLPAGEEDD